MTRGKLLRYVNGTWIVSIKEEKELPKQKPQDVQDLFKAKKKEDKKMSRFSFRTPLFQKVEDWLQEHSLCVNLIFAVLLGVSLALNVFQYKMIDFYKEVNSHLIIKDGQSK